MHEMLCIRMGLEVGGDGAGVQPTKQQWVVLIAFGPRLWMRNSICFGELLSSWCCSWSQLVGVSFLQAFPRISNTHAIYNWASETLSLLRFAFGFSCFRIACGLSSCWNGVPINCGPAHMVFARILFAHILLCWRFTSLR